MNASDIARRVLPKDLYSPLRRWLSARIPLETRMGKQYWSLRVLAGRPVVGSSGDRTLAVD